MTKEAKLVASDPDTPKREATDEPLDDNRPIALVGVSHAHLESHENGETQREEDKQEDKT